MKSRAHFLRDDSGVAIIAVLGILAVVTVIAIAAFFLGQQALHESTRTREQTEAFQCANAGMDAALADIQLNGFKTAHFDPSKTGTVADMGSYEVTVTDIGGGEYRATSVGTANDGSHETVQTQFFYLNLWDVNMGAGEGASLGGGSGWNGNAAIDGPLYVRGDMEWTSNAQFSRGPLFVRDGALTITGSGDVGSVAQPIRFYCTSPVQGKTSQFHGTQSFTVPDIQLPWVNDDYLDAAHARAVLQSTDGWMGDLTAQTNWECDTGDASTYEVALNTPTDGQVTGAQASSPTQNRVRPLVLGPGDSRDYKYLGPDAGPSPLNAGTTNLTIGPTSFGAFPGSGFAPSATYLYDDFAYNASTGTLYLNGLVFIDGDVTFTSAVTQYVGNGTLVANGDILVDGTLLPVGGTYAADKCIGLVTPGDVRLNNAAKCAVFCNGDFSLYETHTYFVGTALAGNIYGDKPNITITMDPLLKTVLPKGMPGVGGGWLAMSAWTRL